MIQHSSRGTSQCKQIHGNILQKYLNQNLWGALLQSCHLAQQSTSVVQTWNPSLFFVLPKEPLSLLLGDREFCFSPIKFEISFNRVGRRYTPTNSAFFQKIYLELKQLKGRFRSQVLLRRNRAAPRRGLHVHRLALRRTGCFTTCL